MAKMIADLALRSVTSRGEGTFTDYDRAPCLDDICDHEKKMEPSGSLGYGRQYEPQKKGRRKLWSLVK